jgi:hypothetical protein
MDTNNSATRLTATLIHVRAIVRDLAPRSLTDEHITLLHEIANFAFSNAQDARLAQVEHDVLLAQMDEHEALIAERLMAESDALDHSAAR